MHLIYSFCVLSFCIRFTAAVTTARVWVNFYRDCPRKSNIMLNSTIPSSGQKHHNIRSPRDVAVATVRSPPVDVRAGECVAVPKVTPNNADSRSVSVEVEITSATPCDGCSIALHEVAGCIDEPLVEADVVGFSESTPCVRRNFVAFDSVWVKLD
ncbi:hypothetical protein VTN49DRAFT_2870 [Thermomyces lanuginosus]|uniref:uncharacterized protein n=1 Tax=Thermomyces lanuginosus TaxID=5541 RepID=UPI0037432275